MKINTLSLVLTAGILSLANHQASASSKYCDIKDVYEAQFAFQRTGNQTAKPESIDIKTTALLCGAYDTDYSGAYVALDTKLGARRVAVATECHETGDEHTLDVELARRALYKAPNADSILAAEAEKILTKFNVTRSEVDTLHEKLEAEKAALAKRIAEEEAAEAEKARLEAEAAGQENGGGRKVMVKIYQDGAFFPQVARLGTYIGL